MRRIAVKVVSLALVVALAGAVAAWAGGGHRGKGFGRTLTVIEHAASDATTDTGATGDSAGDILTFANEVCRSRRRSRGGHGPGLLPPRRGRKVLRVQLDNEPRRRPDHGRGSLPRRRGQHAGDHWRDRPLSQGAWLHEAALAGERHQVRLRVPLRRLIAAARGGVGCPAPRHESTHAGKRTIRKVPRARHRRRDRARRKLSPAAKPVSRASLKQESSRRYYLISTTRKAKARMSACSNPASGPPGTSGGRVRPRRRGTVCRWAHVPTRR